ncbi:MAG TPA: SCO family protein [Verrucomicrobiae bacterium]|jgi:protein SCO1/2|nr:SCO family protein [Verrucomicrobiae bacterium]
MKANFANWLAASALALGSSVWGQSLPDSTLNEIRFEQKVGATVSPKLHFRDEEGNAVQLGNYFGRKPVVLVLGYYKCPMLCTLVLNGMVDSASDIRWSIGKEFEVVDVSINPNETSALAAEKKRTYARQYGRNGSADGWHFLTGDETDIHQLADEVGFRYVYDPASKEYAHPSGLVILTPDGTISHYLFGVTFSSRELSADLQDASVNKTGGPIQQLILLCFHYDPLTGKYSATIVGVLRLMGVATALGIIGLIVWLVRKPKLRGAA